MLSTKEPRNICKLWRFYNNFNKISFSTISNITNLAFYLKRGRENEKNLNDNYMKKKHGQTVVFGDIIQVRKLVLMHYLY